MRFRTVATFHNDCLIISDKHLKENNDVRIADYLLTIIVKIGKNVKNISRNELTSFIITGKEDITDFINAIIEDKHHIQFANYLLNEVLSNDYCEKSTSVHELERTGSIVNLGMGPFNQNKADSNQINIEEYSFDNKNNSGPQDDSKDAFLQSYNTELNALNDTETPTTDSSSSNQYEWLIDQLKTPEIKILAEKYLKTQVNGINPNTQKDSLLINEKSQLEDKKDNDLILRESIKSHKQSRNINNDCDHDSKKLRK